MQKNKNYNMQDKMNDILSQFDEQQKNHMRHYLSSGYLEKVINEYLINNKKFEISKLVQHIYAIIDSLSIKRSKISAMITLNVLEYTNSPSRVNLLKKLV